MKNDKELAAAKLAAVSAGQFLWKKFLNFNRLEAMHKTRHELVTKYDKQSEKIILSTLKSSLGDIAYLSEESTDHRTQNAKYWVVDPLDGTNNFVSHNPIFSVAIALVENQKLILSVVYIPALKELYWAKKGRGAWLNNKKIAPAKNNKISELFVSYCHGQKPQDNLNAYKIYQHFHKHAHDCRHFGSTSIELAWVAAAYTDALIVSHPRLWDVASGILLVQEAGGKLTDFHGQDWQINSQQIIAASKSSYPIINRELKKLGLVKK